MRGKVRRQPDLVCLISPEMAVPKEHPIRPIKKYVDAVLKDLSPLFDEMYAELGRPSIPPERLLKCKVLMALFTVRSERLLVEQIGYNLLFRWFLDMDLDEEVFDASSLSKNQQRFLQHDVAHLFFVSVVSQADQEGWVSSEHFSVDGTLIEAWASMKSFRPKDEDDDGPGGGSNRWVDFHGEKRGNETHQSLCEGLSGTRRQAPCGDDQKPADAGTGRSDLDPSRLQDQSANPPTDRRDLRVDENGGRISPDEIPRHRAQAAKWMADRRGLQLGSDGPTGIRSTRCDRPA